MKTIKDIEKEFEKKFVIKASDGELMADFKNGKEIPVSDVKAFLREAIQIAFKETRVEEKKEKGIYCGCDGECFAECAASFNSALKKIKDKEDTFLELK